MTFDVTSSVTYEQNGVQISPQATSYWWFFVTKSLSLTVSEMFNGNDAI